MNTQKLEDLLSSSDAGPRRGNRSEVVQEVADLSVAVRHRHGMSQRDLADALKVRQATISRWELKLSVPGPWELKSLLDLAKKPPQSIPKRVRKTPAQLHPDHGKIRVKQYYEIDARTMHGRDTRMVIEQNIDGAWKPVPIEHINEDG